MLAHRPVEGELYCNISICIIYFVESIIAKFNLLYKNKKQMVLCPLNI